jgi:hypothetical protein
MCAVAAVIGPIEALRFGAYFRCEAAYCGGCESLPILGSPAGRVVCVAPFWPPHVGGTEWCGDTQSLTLGKVNQMLIPKLGLKLSLLFAFAANPFDSISVSGFGKRRMGNNLMLAV